jgi:Uma2 family endonuclease
MTMVQEAPALTKPLTQADLLALDAAANDGVRIEVTDGMAVEVEAQMTFFHQVIIENAYNYLRPYVLAGKLGSVHTAGLGYILDGTRQRVITRRYPDCSFIRAGRIPADYDWNGDFEGAPDLAVEVASPGQTNATLIAKVAEYLNAGSEEVWVLFPNDRALWRYRADFETPLVYRADETLTTPLFPNLIIPIAALFQTPAL